MRLPNARGRERGGGSSDGGTFASHGQSSQSRYHRDRHGVDGNRFSGVSSDGVINNGDTGNNPGLYDAGGGDTHRGYHLTIGTVGRRSGRSGVDDNDVAGGVGIGAAISTDYNHPNYDLPPIDSSDGDDNILDNSYSSNTSSNRTVSDILSLSKHGFASVYRNGNGDGGAGSEKSSLDTSSSLSSLGVDGLVNDHSFNNYNSGIIDGAAGGDGGFPLLAGYDYHHSNGTHIDLDSFSQRLFDQIEFKMGDDLTRYVCPAIIVLGNISNFIAFLVLRRKKFKNSSVAFYMRAYALANLCFLDLMLGIAWVCLVLEIQYLAHRTDWSCRLWTFISNVITYSGIWFVVVMSIDRFVYANLPNKASGYCSVFTAKGIATFVLICLIVVSIHAMWTFELQPQGCWVSHQDDDLHKLTWPWWSAALYSYIPLLLLLVQIIAQSVSFCVRVFVKSPNSPPNASRGAVDQDTFVLPVFVITVAFFFLTIPSTAINLLDIHLPSNMLHVEVIAKIELTKKITELLSSFNNSLLGIILVALSPAYRTELLGFCRSIFCCIRTRKLKMFEMRNVSQSEDSSPHTQADYELCNNNDDNIATDV